MLLANETLLYINNNEHRLKYIQACVVIDTVYNVLALGSVFPWCRHMTTHEIKVVLYSVVK